MKNIQRTLILSASIVALAGCGADEIVSPGTSGDIIINNPPAPPPPPPAADDDDDTPVVTPAAGCPTINSTGGLTDAGTITGPTGEYRQCNLPDVFDADDSLPFIPGLLYALPGRVDVGSDQGFASTGTDVTLEIEPGVIIFGDTGVSFLVVNRGNTIESNGTPTNPIIWTSRDNVLGLNNDDSDQQWGGVVLLGRAPVSDCSTGVFNTAASPNTNPQCEQLLEGTTVPTVFGGADDGDSSGSMSYNQIRYSGFAIAPGDELQSLTTGGIGNGTEFTGIQSFNSSDDGIEFFGGIINMANVAVVGASDDSIDADTGAQGNLQFVVVAQRSSTGDTSIELDSPSDDFSTDAFPQTVLNVTNFTFIQNSGDDEVVNSRGGAQLNLSNGVMDAMGTPCLFIDEVVSLNAGSTFNSIQASCGDPAIVGSDGVSDMQASDLFFAGTNNATDAAVTFTNGFFFDASATPAFDATATSSFFEAADFIGALESADDTRFEGWACDSTTLDFGTGNDCTSLPIREGEG